MSQSLNSTIRVQYIMQARMYLTLLTNIGLGWKWDKHWNLLGWTVNYDEKVTLLANIKSVM